jgi:DNA-binding NarL/FixJ family response regulator
MLNLESDKNMPHQRLLIISTDSVLVSFIEEKLKNKEVEIVTAFGVKDGARKCREKKPQLVLLEIPEGDINVREVLGFMHKQLLVRSVLVLSSNGNPELMNKCISDKACIYLLRQHTSIDDILEEIFKKLEE